MKPQETALIIILVLTCIVWGCNTQNQEEEREEITIKTATEIDSGQLLTYGNLLGAADDAVINLLGEGEPGYVKGEDGDIISGRLYQQGVLGFSGETVVDYNSTEPPMVESVIITFKGTTFEDVVDVISQQLGEVMMIERTTGNRAQAIWEYNDIVFDLTFYGGTLMLTIEKNT